MMEMFEFEKLRIYQKALDFIDMSKMIAGLLKSLSPNAER